MRRIDHLRTKVRPFTPEHVAREMWAALWRRTGIYEGKTFEQWLQEEIEEQK